MRCSHDGDWYKIVNDFHSNALITSTSIWPSVSWLGCILTTDRFCAASSSKRVSTYGISLASQIFIAWAAAGDHSGPKIMPTRNWTEKRNASDFFIDFEMRCLSACHLHSAKSKHSSKRKMYFHSWPVRCLYPKRFHCFAEHFDWPYARRAAVLFPAHRDFYRKRHLFVSFSDEKHNGNKLKALVSMTVTCRLYFLLIRW